MVIGYMVIGFEVMIYVWSKVLIVNWYWNKYNVPLY